MRFIILGAGGVGGVLAGRLFEHGYDVVLVARGANYEALSREGLRVESPDATVTLSVPVVASTNQIIRGGDDVVLLSVKSQDTGEALRSLTVTFPATTPIVCAQNGVENERRTLRYFREVYGLCVMCPTTHLSPGVVQAHSSPVTGIMDLGRWPHGVDDRARSLAATLENSTYVSEARADIARWKWGKLLMNLGNALEALCGPGGRGSELYARARLEAITCLHAARINFVDTAEDEQRRGDLLSSRPIAGSPRGGGSTWQSLIRGTGTIETDYLNGEIVLLGRQHGVLTPVNELLQRLARRVAHERRGPGTYTESQLWDLLRETPSR